MQIAWIPTIASSLVIIATSIVILKSFNSARRWVMGLDVFTKKEVKDLIDQCAPKKSCEDRKELCGVSFDGLRRGQEIIHEEMRSMRTSIDRMIDVYITQGRK